MDILFNYDLFKHNITRFLIHFPIKTQQLDSNCNINMIVKSKTTNTI